MKFEVSELALTILQFLGWAITGGALIAAALNVGGTYGAPTWPIWLAVAAAALGGAIAATLGRVQIHTLSALVDIEFLLREQSEKPR